MRREAARWALRAALVLVAAAAGGCGDDTDPRAHVPRQFGAVPGNAAVVVADRAAFAADDAAEDPPSAPLDRELAAALDRGAAEAGLREAGGLPPGIVAWTAAELPTGWPDLRTSASFQDAWATLPPVDAGARLVAFADLQLLVDVGRRRWRGELPGALAGGIDTLGLQALRWALATLQRDPDGGVCGLDGTIRSSGSRRGVVALLRTAQPAAGGLLAVEADDALVVDVGFDPVVARSLLDDLAAAERDTSPGALFGAVAAGLRTLLGEALAVSDGRAALRVGADGRLRFACGVTDAAAAAEVLARYGRPLDDGRYLLPGRRFAALDGHRLVALPAEDDPLPARGASGGEAGPALRLRRRTAAGEVDAVLRRRDAANLRLQVRWED